MLLNNLFLKFIFKNVNQRQGVCVFSRDPKIMEISLNISVHRK